MKELSIQEKAQRYDEAIIRGSQLWESDAITRENYEYIFPELKESEDKRIRKEIINFIKVSKPKWENYRDYSSWITWLEKQGEKKPAHTDFSDLRTWKYIVDVVWTEKEGIGQYLDSPFTEEVAKKLQKRFGNIEQKPAEKVEPKFHEGEWMCENEPNNYARFIQILEIVNVQGKERYRISRDSHNDEDVVEFGFVEKYYHKFDIQDAKDGDVLACNSDILSICIFAHFDGINNKYDSFLCYCGLEGEGLGQELNINGYHDDSTGYVPATREQRDTLKKAMADAGYEFDFEKKELKKIEQKPAVIIPKFRIGDEIKTANGDPLTITEITDGGYWSEDLFICDFDEECVWDLVVQKTAWSEEDEDMCYKAIAVINRLCAEGKDYVWSIKTLKKLFYWLKSLKERYAWKPSEEQLETLENVRKILHSNKEIYSKINHFMFNFEELIRTLKKLREE